MSYENYAVFSKQFQNELEKLDYEQRFNILLIVVNSLKNTKKDDDEKIRNGLSFIEKYAGSIDRVIDEKKELMEYLDEKYENFN